jgi:Skp family chaperone for outer membrane proteins
MIGLAGAAQNDDAKKAAPAAQAAGSSTQYKIGIVDRRAVLQGYNKVTAERKKLESDVETENKEIDKLAADLQAAKEGYDKEKDSLSTTEREEREMALNKQLMEYQTKLQTKQAEVDARERQLMKRFFTDIDAAVQKIGESENYHLIIDGSKGTSTLFFAPAMDMSQKVIDYLNAGSN